MEIDLIKLNSGTEEYLEIEEELKISEDFLKNTDIISIDPVLVKGFISKGIVDYNLNIEISGTMYLPCAITLKPVKFPFLIKIDKELSEISEEFDKNFKINENTIDIFPIIWENILVEIPMKVVSEDATYNNLKGEGWELVTEEKQEKEINPELAKLKDLL